MVPSPQDLRTRSAPARLATSLASAVASLAHTLARAEGDTEIHAQRKSLKRCRALLRILRPALGEARFRRENRTLRDVGRALAGVRDARVLAGTLSSLVERASLEPAALEPLTSTLAAELDLARAVPGRAARLLALARELRACARRLRSAPLEGRDWHALAAGHAAVYRRGRRAFARARRRPTPARLHEWRKQVKNYWHALEPLVATTPGLKGLLRDVHRLADRLGDDHDLALLRERLADGGIGGRTRREAVARLDDRRAALEAEAFALGERLYGARTRRLRPRFRGYWRRWASVPPPPAGPGG
jgi:CHAD domain-containing protein